MSNRFAKSVAFNNQNEVDQKILKHISRRNFSGYVKKLILAEIQAKEEKKGIIPEIEKTAQIEEVRPEETPIKLTAAEKLEELKKKAGFLK